MFVILWPFPTFIVVIKFDSTVVDEQKTAIIKNTIPNVLTSAHTNIYSIKQVLIVCLSNKIEPFELLKIAIVFYQWH